MATLVSERFAPTGRLKVIPPVIVDIYASLCKMNLNQKIISFTASLNKNLLFYSCVISVDIISLSVGSARGLCEMSYSFTYVIIVEKYTVIRCKSKACKSTNHTQLLKRIFSIGIVVPLFTLYNVQSLHPIFLKPNMD